MSSLKERVEEMTKQFGLTSKGSLKQDVDALREATDIHVYDHEGDPSTRWRASASSRTRSCRSSVRTRASEATGKLGDDAVTLCKEIGVDQDLKFPMALNALVESMGIDVKPDNFEARGTRPEAQKEPDVKKVDAPCVCKNGLHQLMSLRKAKEHPCVCEDICLDGPRSARELLQGESPRVRLHRQHPRHILLESEHRNGTATERWLLERLCPRVQSSECRQHNDESDDDDVDDLGGGRQAREEEVAHRK